MSDERSERPLFPSTRAFVVLLRGDCAPGRDDLRGRVEHVRSGRSAHFTSIDELLDFLAGLTRTDGEGP